MCTACTQTPEVRDVIHAHLGRLGGRQRAHVLGEPPQLVLRQELLVDQVRERRHRRAVEPGAQAAIDVSGRAAAVEAPVLGEVRREDRLARVVLEGRRRRTVAAALVAVALAAADRVVEQPPRPERRGGRAAARLLGELERHRMLRRVGEEGRERLDVGDHVAPLGLGQPRLPAGHRRAAQPLVDRPHQVGVGRQLAARRGADLVDCAREVARPGQHVARGGPVPRAAVAVAAGAPFHVDPLAGGGVLGG